MCDTYPEQPGLYESVQLVARADWSLETIDTIGVFRARSLIVYASGGRHTPTYIGPPFGPWGWMRIGGIPAKLAYTPADAYRIEIYELEQPAGKLVIERSGGLRSPTKIERESFERAFTGATPYGRRPSGNPSEFRHLVTPVDSLSIITAAPYVDDMNAVWAPVEPYGTFEVFNAEGLYLGRVMAPNQIRIHEIGADYILGVRYDDMDVEYVVMYRLNRSQVDGD